MGCLHSSGSLKLAPPNLKSAIIRRYLDYIQKVASRIKLIEILKEEYIYNNDDKRNQVLEDKFNTLFVNIENNAVCLIQNIRIEKNTLPEYPNPKTQHLESNHRDSLDAIQNEMLGLMKKFQSLQFAIKNITKDKTFAKIKLYDPSVSFKQVEEMTDSHKKAQAYIHKISSSHAQMGQAVNEINHKLEGIKEAERKLAKVNNLLTEFHFLMLQQNDTVNSIFSKYEAIQDHTEGAVQNLTEAKQHYISAKEVFLSEDVLFVHNFSYFDVHWCELCSGACS